MSSLINLQPSFFPRPPKMLASPAAFFLLLFVSSCAIHEPRFEASPASTFRAVSRSEIKEALAFYEARAQEAEKNAAASRFPEQYWRAASAAYSEASRAARLSGQLQKSITYGEKSLDIAEKIKNPARELASITALVLAYRTLRNFDKARALIDKGFEAAKKIPANTNVRVSWESILYDLLGRDLARKREYEKAFDAFLQSIYRREQTLADLYRWRAPQTRLEVVRSGVLMTLGHLGDAYRQTGRLQEALQQYQRAFDSIKEWGLKYAFEDELYLNIGEVYLLQKNFSAALENFKKALALAESQQMAANIRRASDRIGAVLLETEKPSEAVTYYQKAIQQTESTRSLLESEEFRQSYFEGALRPYISIMRALRLIGKHEEAFNYSERARSRVFLDVLGNKARLSRAKSGLFEEEQALQERIAVIKARLSDEEDGEADRAVSRKELSAAEKSYSAFLSKVRKQDKEQASLMTVEPLTLKEVKELLDSGTTLIEYFVTPANILIWVVEKDRMRSLRVQLPREELGRLVKALRESIIAVGEREKFNEVSSFLYEQLIAPFLPHVTGKELIIVPHDVLHYLPFHALLSPEGKYLIEKYPIYYLSSASLLQFTKEKRKAKGDLSAVLAQAGKVLAFGNPDLGDPKMSLEFAELEAKEVQKLYPQSTVLLKREATEEKSKELSPRHDIVHFATHAELNEDDPLSSAVLLAKDGKEDGRLEVREIFGMDLKANLVVLSACETGLGKLSTGDELVGLTRAFIYAGTPSVVASLWKVEDSSTAQLMGSFYKNLKTLTKVEALRQAQLELIRGEARSDLLARRGVGGIGRLGETPQPKDSSQDSISVSVPASVSTSHPYFWAPFILVGDAK